MAIRELKDQIARLPEQPGVYLYFNAAGDTIYVGKARALRDRVRMRKTSRAKRRSPLPRPMVRWAWTISSKRIKRRIRFNRTRGR